MLSIAVGSAAFAAVLVLPGFGLMWVVSRWGLVPQARVPDSIFGPHDGDAAATLVCAIAWSTLSLAALGSALVAVGRFSSLLLGGMVLALGCIGVWPFLSWIRTLRTEWVGIAAVAMLTLPFVWSSLRGNLAPTHSYQWYYWELGNQLDSAAGVPEWIIEFGQRVRWHPDYVFSAFLTEAYRGATGPLDEATAITVLRAPAAALATGLAYLFFRLWVSRTAGVIGVAALAGTTLYITKLNAYKPEAIAIAVAFAAAWLIVVSVRDSRPSAALLGGATLGVAVGIHGIAAAVVGSLGLAAASVEAISLDERRIALISLVGACVLASAVVLTTGLAIQGRATVAADAAHPKLSQGDDPTWTFLQRHDGIFTPQEQAPVGQRIQQTLEHPWPGDLVGRGGWLAVAAAVAVGCGVAIRRWVTLRHAAFILIAAVGLLAAALAFFATAFDTYIPQHTGITRIGAYLGLLFAFGVAILVQLVMDESLVSRGRVLPSLAAVCVGVFFIAWAARTDIAYLGRSPGIGQNGREALRVLGEVGRPGEAVLSNISTRGLIEFETELENPVEGRQPVIEDQRFLMGANHVLREIQTFFQVPRANRGILRRLSIDWLLVSNARKGIGSPYHFGVPAGQVAKVASLRQLRPVWRNEHSAIFSNRVAQPSEVVGPRKELGVKIALGFSVLALILFGLRSILHRART